MKSRILCWLPFALLLSFSIHAQKIKKADKVIITRLQQHITYLADDKLEGRRAGSRGEKLAAAYIVQQLQQAGAQPKGDSNWYQPYVIDDGRQVDRGTFFFVNGRDLKLMDEFFPLAYSANESIETAVSIALAERGVPWFMDLKELLTENRNNPHFDLHGAIRSKAAAVAARGATALILFNSSAIPDGLQFEPRDGSPAVSIPVLYVAQKAKKQYMRDESATLDMKIRVDIREKKRLSYNVIGYIDNGAPTTVVVGAHYDHLGYGEDGNTLFSSTDSVIYNGADDNASGTAALIELAHLLKQSKKKSNNYLLAVFSGEELGLLGSRYFVEHSTIDLGTVNYMVNMDMVGRLNDTTKALIVGGYGTSPSWPLLLARPGNRKYFAIRYDSSGVGPSDHASFYLKQIPVLFFFTGLHQDYHKPTDDASKINYMGELEVIKFIDGVLEAVEGKNRLAFTKTHDSMPGMVHFSVTLGILPDYSFNGGGVRVDNVSDNRPAQKAGIRPGDVIVQLGDYPTNSLETYMQALSRFKKGDQTRVKYKRGTDVLEADVTF